MNRNVGVTVMAGALALAACQQQPATDAGATPGPEQSAPVDPSPSTSATTQPMPAAPDRAVATTGENDGSPDITPAPLTAEAARTETGARANLLAWARGIELREFDQAWGLMGDAAKTQISKAQFNALFHPIRDIAVAVPGGEMEGAAGSSYYTVPTTVTGIRADGSKTVLKGEVVLRRVNDVPGATPAQLAWHIERVTLAPT